MFLRINEKMEVMGLLPFFHLVYYAIGTILLEYQLHTEFAL